MLKESVEQHKYLEIQIEVKNISSDYLGNRTVLVALDSLKYNNSNTITFEKDISFTLISDWANVTIGVQCYLKNEKEIVIASAQTINAAQGTLRIKNVYGLK